MTTSDTCGRPICSRNVDVAPPELTLDVLLSYLVDVQFTLLAISAAWTVWLWRVGQGRARQAVLLVALNLAVNLIFFMTHSIFTPYYIIPIDMLCLWTAVRNARLVRRTGRRSRGLPSTGPRLIAV